MKICPTCGESKEKSSFGKSKQTKDGLYGCCKSCKSIRAKKFNSGAYAKNAALLKNYGVTLAAFNALLTSQGGHCALCERTELLGLDHDHVTLKVRGILCRKCNLALGHFDDSIPKMVAAITYLGK